MQLGLINSALRRSGVRTSE